MHHDVVIDWLLEGDVAIQFQTWRDLKRVDKPGLQQRIPREGWGKRFLDLRLPNGHWGRGFYMPKWTSSHYTLLDLKFLNAPQDHPLIRQSIQQIAVEEKWKDGGINPHSGNTPSDVCVNGMFLQYGCYFRLEESTVRSVVDFILSQQVGDGGFNCYSNTKGCVHSSLHTTLSVLEGFWEYSHQGYTYRLADVAMAVQQSCEFILMHRLFKSDKTGAVIDPRFTRLSFPCRWRYDILRAMDYFQMVDFPWDDRMTDALEVILQKRMPGGFWPVQQKYPGETHFDMEKPGQISRWNTLRVRRVLKKYGLTQAPEKHN
jgi:hypothetical protein